MLILGVKKFHFNILYVCICMYISYNYLRVCTTVDTAYEGMQKRTSLIMLMLVVLHSPFLIEMIVLYHKLGPSPNPLGNKRETPKS